MKIPIQHAAFPGYWIRFPTESSKAVSLLQFFFVCGSVVFYVVFVLSLFFIYPQLILFTSRLVIMKTRLFKYIENFTTWKLKTFKWKILVVFIKKWKFSDKNSNIFHISAQNIDSGHWLEPPRRGGSNKYPQSMSLSRNKKINVYPCKPKFYYIKMGFKGVNII